MGSAINERDHVAIRSAPSVPRPESMQDMHTPGPESMQDMHTPGPYGSRLVRAPGR